MAYGIVRKILDRERQSFRRIDRRWMPTSLSAEPYRRAMLKDVLSRYREIASAVDEFKTLVRAEMYSQLLRRMRVAVRQANFSWRFDDLSFLQAVADFYGSYGTVLRLLMLEDARGNLSTEGA